MSESDIFESLGMELFLRAYSLHTTGLTTLKGAMFYVPKNSGSLCDALLHALNGSEVHREKIRSFFGDENVSRLANKHSGLSDFFVEKKGMVGP